MMSTIMSGVCPWTMLMSIIVPDVISHVRESWCSCCCFPCRSSLVGLVSAVYPVEDLVEEAVKVAAKIGSMSMPIALMAKEAVNAAFEGNLTEGVRLERRIFHATFALVNVLCLPDVFMCSYCFCSCSCFCFCSCSCSHVHS